MLNDHRKSIIESGIGEHCVFHCQLSMHALGSYREQGPCMAYRQLCVKRLSAQHGRAGGHWDSELCLSVVWQHSHNVDDWRGQPGDCSRQLNT